MLHKMRKRGSSKWRIKTHYTLVFVISFLLVGSLSVNNAAVMLLEHVGDESQDQSLQPLQGPVDSPVLSNKVLKQVKTTLTGFTGGFMENYCHENDIQYLIHSSQASVSFDKSKIHFLIRSPKQSNQNFQDPLNIHHKKHDQVLERENIQASITFPGSNPVIPAGKNPIDTYINYFRGSDPTQWVINKHYYSKLIYSNLYPNIDLIYEVREGKLKYEFFVYPGGDIDDIQIRWDGPISLNLLSTGLEIIMNTNAGSLPIIDRNPINFQGFAREDPIDGSFELIDPQTYGFSIPSYDPNHLLIIDPTLDFSTFLGGLEDDYGLSISLDDVGNIYVTGMTDSPDFPTPPDAYNSTHGGDLDVFVSKLTNTGDILLYSTFIGGSGEDRGYSLNVDNSGNAYITGYTGSSDFPTTSDAYNNTYGGETDVFVTKLAANGSTLFYSTYLGGSDFDRGKSLITDDIGNAYITGNTGSLDFPTTSEAYNTTHNGGSDVFVTKLAANGSILHYSTFLGGLTYEAGECIKVDVQGNVYVTGPTDSPEFPTTPEAYNTGPVGGQDIFVSKLAANGSVLLYSTYLGGSGYDLSHSLVVDAEGNVYVTGETHDDVIDFPTTTGVFNTTHNGVRDLFVTGLAANGSTLLYSTFFGGSGLDIGNSLTIDIDGNIYVAGQTTGNLLITSNAYDTTHSGSWEGFLAKITNGGTKLLYSTYLGGSAADYCSSLVIDAEKNVYITGYTVYAENVFPSTPNAYDNTHNGYGDIFVTKLCNFPEKPDKIQELSIEVNEDQQIVLFWTEPFDGNSPISGYRIYRGSSSGSYEFLASTSSQYYYDTSATSGQTYYYVVSAVNSVGESLFSNEVSASRTEPSMTIPAAPQSLATLVGELFVYLNWTEPTNDGGSPVTGYRVYRGVSSGDYILSFSTTNTYFNDTLVLGDTTYFYVITALNSVGESLFSTEQTATPLGESIVQTVPSVPRDLTYYVTLDGIVITWITPMSDGHAAITSYRIYRGSSNGGPYTMIGTTNTLHYEDTTAVIEDTYYYVVTAVNSIGESNYSDEIEVSITFPTSARSPFPVFSVILMVIILIVKQKKHKKL